MFACRNLNLSYKGNKILKDIHFHIPEGTVFCITGESGSGKSTLAKMITRLTDITEGTLKFEGKDITRLKHNQLKDVYGNIQMVFQLSLIHI